MKIHPDDMVLKLVKVGPTTILEAHSRDGEFLGQLLAIDHGNGTMHRYTSLGDDLSFQLDAEGRILLDEQGTTP